MQDRRAILEDLASLARGAAAVCRGLGRAAAGRVEPAADRLRSRLGSVPREEFEAVREMAENARAENERLSRRIAALEKRGGARRAPKAGAGRARTARRKPAGSGGAARGPA